MSIAAVTPGGPTAVPKQLLTTKCRYFGPAPADTVATMFPRTSALLCATLCCAIASCYTPKIADGLPCTASSTCPEGQVCDVDLQICEARPASIWKLDSAKDFEAAGAVIEGTVDPDGAISAPRYLSGAVRISAANRSNASNVRTAGWEEITRAPSGTGYVRSLFQTWADDKPSGVGLTKTENITIWIEGELFLEAGDWQFRLFADDEGFVDLSPPGGSFARLVEATYMGSATVPYTAAKTGWYPFRGAVKDLTQGMFFLFEAGRGAEMPRQISPERMRVSVGAQHGVTLESFGRGYLLSPRAATLAAQLGGEFGAGVPPDLGLLNADDWSLRYSGQFFVDKAQTLQLSVTSQGGHRVWMDRQLLSDRLGASAVEIQTPAIDLGIGWHDVVIELMKQAPGTGQLQLRVIQGDPTLFARERLRPVEGALRVIGAENTSSSALPANATVSPTLVLGSSALGTVRAVNLSYTATGALADLSVQVDTPSITIPVRASGSLTGARIVDYLTIVTTPTPIMLSTWRVIARNGGATAGTFGPVAVAVEYEGSTAQTGDAFRYTSAVHELEPGAEIRSVRWGTQPSNSPLRVSVRTCATATCADGTWIDVASSGSTPAIEAGAFAQLRVEAATSQASPVRLEFVEIRSRQP
jgi:hypothetical protein